MERKLLSNIDWPLVIIVLLLTLVGLANLYSATYGLPVAKYFKNQMIWILLGLIVFILASLVNYLYMERAAYFIYGFTILLLVLVLVTGNPIGGSVRWLHLGPLTIQPSELAKLAVIIMLAKIFAKREQQPPYNLVQLIVPLLVILLPMGLINLQPDLGTTLVLGITGVSIILYVGVHRRTIIGMAIAIAVSLPLAWIFLLSAYQKSRVITFLNPEKYRLAGGYQVIQSKIAVGSGMLTGKGFLSGTQSKLMFLPKQHTDFIFSNFAEEWGFLGSMFLMACFFLFILSALNIAMRAKDRFGTLLAFGIAAYFFWHFFINIGMELGLLPVVGLPLPFLSYGGSVTISAFVAFGLLMNVGLRRFLF